MWAAISSEVSELRRRISQSLSKAWQIFVEGVVGGRDIRKCSEHYSHFRILSITATEQSKGAGHSLSCSITTLRGCEIESSMMDTTSGCAREWVDCGAVRNSRGGVSNSEVTGTVTWSTTVTETVYGLTVSGSSCTWRADE